jgi:dTDP-4-dehydrorhamnose reductase
MTAVLVIGAGGMLGREVARAAESRGAVVVGTGRAPLPGRVAFDARRDNPAELFRNPVDLVVNCAAVLASEIDPSDEDTVAAAEWVNAMFPHALAEQAGRHGARLVHISTDAVFREDAGTCREDDTGFAGDVYGSTKRRGEPAAANALSLRCSFVGWDPARHRGLLEWLLAQPDGAEVQGFTDQIWNGLASTQVAAVCAAVANPDLFCRARDEGPVHHLFEDPPLTKCALLKLCADVFGKPVTVVPQASLRPVSRVLATRHTVLRECLESGATRSAALAELAREGETRDG